MLALISLLISIRGMMYNQRTLNPESYATKDELSPFETKLKH